MFTAEQIDAMSREMIAKAQAHYRDEVLSRMDQSALKTLEQKAFLEIKLKRYITNAFLEGVAQAMSYIAAVLQRKAQSKDDA